MRVAVRIFGLGEERVGGGEFFQDREVGGRRFLRGEVFNGFEGVETDEVGGHLAVVEVASVGAYRTVNFQFVAEAGEIVVGAVAGRGVDGTRAAVGRDVVGEDDGRGAVDEGVASGEAFEGGAFDRGDDGGSALDLGG